MVPFSTMIPHSSYLHVFKDIHVIWLGRGVGGYTIIIFVVVVGVGVENN